MFLSFFVLPCRFRLSVILYYYPWDDRQLPEMMVGRLRGPHCGYLVNTMVGVTARLVSVAVKDHDLDDHVTNR